MLDAKLPEGMVEVVPGGDPRGGVTVHLLVARHQPEVAAMTSLAARFGVAGVDDEPVGPGLEPVWVPEPREVLPRVEQRPLCRVLGEERVAQDPARDRVEVVTHAFDQGVERRFVAAHRSLDESSLHPSPPGPAASGRFAEYE